ncbi:MAG: cyanophycin synthetase [Pseudomonadota bacterium]
MKRLIEIVSVVYLRGPNMWTYDPALEALIDIGDLEDFPSNLIPGLPDRLVDWMPGLEAHRCSYDEPGGFIRRLREGTWPGHILEHLTLELQALAGMPGGGFGRAREVSARGIYKVVVSLWHERVTLRALEGARDVLMAAIEDRPFDLAGLIADIEDLADRHCLGPSTAAIVQAADDRRIPMIRLNEGNLVQLGYGSAQRRIWTAETDRTSAIAEGISTDKDLTKQLLSACGLPIPEGQVVADAAQAWEVAQEIGLPVVVKPIDGNHGRGVCLDLQTREQVEAAFPVAAREGSAVLVERHVRGNEHRLLVIGGRLAAAARGQPAYVTGDGRSSIRTLIDEQLNSDPLRGVQRDRPLNRVGIDSATRIDLRTQGYEPESIPPAGELVLVQRNGNVCFDCTALVHPEAARAAVLAARIIGLDIAGIDLVVEDISKSLSEQRGAIVEVNAGPGLTVHVTPPGVPPYPVGDSVVDDLFREGATGRIPIIGVAGTSGTTETVRLIDHFMRLGPARTACASSEGLFVGSRRIAQGDSTGWEAGRRLLINPAVDLAIFEHSVRALIDEGLAYDRSQVGVLTCVEAHAMVPARYIDSEDLLWRVLRTPIDVVLKNGVAVLNAEDPQAVAMAELADGEILYFAMDADCEALIAHRAQGRRWVTADASHVLLMQGDERVASLTLREDLSAVRALRLGGARGAASPAPDQRPVDPLVAAVAAVWAAGLAVHLIEAGLDTLNGVDWAR